MPDAPLVGKVAIKVIPDTEDFRDELKRGVERESQGVEAEVDAKIKSDNQIKESLLKSVHRVNGEIKGDDRYAVKVPVKLDEDGVKSQLRELVRELKRMVDDIKVEVELSAKGVERVKEQIQEAARDADATIHVNKDGEIEKELSKAIKGLQGDIDSLSFRSLGEKLGRSLRDKVNAKLDLRINRDAFQRDLRDILSRDVHQKVKIDIDAEHVRSKLVNALERAGSKAVIKGLQLNFDPVAMDRLQGRIDRYADALQRRLNSKEMTHFVDVIPRIKAQLGSVLGSAFHRDGPVIEKTRVSIDGLYQALRRLSGQRLHWDYIRPGIDVAKDLDRVAMSTAKVATNVMAIGSGATWAVGGLLGFTNGLGKIFGAALVLPGALAGVGVSIGILVSALKDFKKQVPSAARMFDEMNKAGNVSFWGKARDSIKEMTDVILPKAIKGYGKVGSSLGKLAAKMSDSIKKFVAPELDRFFSSLSKAIDNSGGWADAMGRVAASFLSIASDYMPKMGRWLGDVSTKFANWLDQAVKTGKAHQWIDEAWRNMKNLGSVLKDTFDVMASLSRAASEAGFGLESSARAMRRLDEITSSPGFQKGLVDVFRASREAMQEITSRVGPEMGAMFKNLVKTFTTSAPLAGEAIGTIGAALAKSFADPRFSEGINDMFTSIRDGAVASAPYLKDVGANLGTLARILGNTFEDLVPIVARSLEGLTKNFADMEEPIDRITTALAGALGPVLDEISPIIGEVMVWALNRMAEASEWLARKVENLPKKIRDAKAEFANFYRANKDLIDGLGTTIAKVGALLAVLSPMAPLLKAMSLFLSPMGRLLGGFASGALRAAGGGSAFQGILKGLSGARGLLPKLFKIVGKPLPVGMFTGIGAVAAGFLASLKLIYENSERMRRALAPLGDQIRGIGTAIKDTFGKLGQGDFSGFVDGFRDIGRSIGEALRTAIHGVTVGIFDPEWRAVLIARLLTAFQDAPAKISAFWSGIDWSQVLSFATAPFMIGFNLITGIIEGLLGVDLAAATSQIWRGFIDFVKGIFGIHSPSVVFHQMGVDIIQGLINGLMAMGGLLSAAASMIGHLVVEGFRAAVAGLGAVWEGIKTAASIAWEGIRVGAQVAWDAIKLGASATWEAMKATASVAWNGIRTVASTAWEGMKTGAAAAWEAMKTTASTAWNGMKTVASTTWNGIKTVASTAWGGIKTTVSSAASTAAAKVKEGFTTMKTNASTKLNELKADASSKWSSIKADTSSKVNQMKSDVSSKFGQLKSDASSKLSQVKSDASSKWQSIKSDVSSKTSSIKSDVSSKFESVRSTISSKMSNAKSAATQAFNSIKSTGTSNFNSLKSSISSAMESVRSSISTKMSSAKSSASQAASGIKSSVTQQVNSMKSSVSSTVGQVPGIFSRMGSSIRSIVGGINLSGIGRNMVQGLVNGMRSMLGSVRSIASSIASAAANAIRAKAQIHSPSRVWMGLGEYMGEGLAIGIEDQTRLVKNASASLLDIPSKMELDLPKVHGVSSTNSSRAIRAMAGELGGPIVGGGVNVTQNVYSSDPMVAARAASDQLEFALA